MCVILHCIRFENCFELDQIFYSASSIYHAGIAELFPSFQFVRSLIVQQLQHVYKHTHTAKCIWPILPSYWDDTSVNIHCMRMRYIYPIRYAQNLNLFSFAVCVWANERMSEKEKWCVTIEQLMARVVSHIWNMMKCHHTNENPLYQIVYVMCKRFSLSVLFLYLLAVFSPLLSLSFSPLLSSNVLYNNVYAYNSY